MTRALISCGHLQRHFAKFSPEFERFGVEPHLPEIRGQQLDAEDMRRHVVGCAGIIAGDDFIDRSVLEAGKASGLQMVIKWGVGTDSIDKRAASELCVPVYNTPGTFGEEVADLALAFMLLLIRQLHRMHASVVDGGWLKVEGRSPSGMTAGIVGLGSVGRAIARRVHGFGMQAIGSDVVAIDETELARSHVRQRPFERVLAESDIVFIATNLTTENRHLFNGAAFAQMKPDSYLINVSRGPVVDEGALAAALSSKRLAGAGLDVFEIEPLPATSPLRSFENCVFGTHNGSNTREAVDRVNRLTVDMLFHLLGKKTVAGLQPNRVA
jgi:D-3-phosphoglycerate dehydrogenase